LPKFNARNAPARAKPNAPFTAHSRDKSEPGGRSRRYRCEYDRRNATNESFNQYDPRKYVEEYAMKSMSKSLTAIAVAATIAVAAVATPQPAEARGGHIAAGIVGGLAVGAIIGGIAANGPYGYYGPAYYGPGPYYGPGCYWSHQRVWDGWGWHYQRVRVCG
jgi:hypothetical protein